MGGGSSQPTPPAQPSTADAVNAWIAGMPQVYQTQLQYAPLQAQQQVELAQKYAGDYGKAMQAAQAALYPETSKLQEQLAKQASEGMSSSMPESMQKQYQSNMNARLGTNNYSPIGADYASRGLMQQQEDWKKYYQNLGLSTAGRQPLTAAGTPATTDYMSGFTPQSVMGFMGNTYGTAGNIFGAQSQAASSDYGAMMNLYGSMLGAGGQAGAGYFMSSMRYKKNIRIWN